MSTGGTSTGKAPGAQGTVNQGNCDRGPSDLTGKIILVLDDEVLIGMDICDTLDDEGAAAHYARTLEAGMKLTNRDLDGAILDVNLGAGTDCTPVAARLREKGVPFVLYSGDLDRTGEIVRGIGAPLVRKPNTMSHLMETLRGVL